MYLSYICARDLLYKSAVYIITHPSMRGLLIKMLPHILSDYFSSAEKSPLMQTDAARFIILVSIVLHV